MCPSSSNVPKLWKGVLYQGGHIASKTSRTSKTSKKALFRPKTSKTALLANKPLKTSKIVGSVRSGVNESKCEIEVYRVSF